MFVFDPFKKIPCFILQDKNGFAIAKAIEAGMQMMNDTIKQGVDFLNDYDTMPEWRLDELAWEYNALYDYDADIATKRRWMRNVEVLYSLHGTPNAIHQYLAGYFSSVMLEEAADYGGEPFHFRVSVSGIWNNANEAWLRKAIEASKNVRSVLDNISVGSGATIIMRGDGAEAARFPYDLTSESLYAGTRPTENMIGAFADNTTPAITDGKAMIFSYSPCAADKPCGVM